jgi:hypothetical protein
MTPRELMLQPTGSRITVNGPGERLLRFLNWLGYWPERIDGARLPLIKQLAPGYCFTVPLAEQAAYARMVSAS